MTVLVMLLALPALSAFAAEGSRGSTPTLNTKDTGYRGVWADGHGRQPSASSLYFCNKTGDVYRLPPRMTEEFARPERIHAQNQN